MVNIDLSAKHAVSNGIERVTDEYGLVPSTIVLMAGVIGSLIDSSGRINPQVWIFSVIGILSFVYLFRSTITRNLLHAAAYSLVSLFVLSIPAIYMAHTSGFLAIDNLSKSSSELFTAYLALSLCTPLAIVLLSYKRSDHSKLPLSAPLDSLVAKNITSCDILFKRDDYTVWLEAVDDDRVLFRFEDSATGFNRSRYAAEFRGMFDPLGEDARMTYISVNARPIDLNDEEAKTRRGYLLRYLCQSGETFELRAEGRAYLRHSDSQLMGCYKPTEQLSVRVFYPKDKIKLVAHYWTNSEVIATQMDDGSVKYDIPEGNLPHQGIRLIWDRMNND